MSPAVVFAALLLAACTIRPADGGGGGAGDGGASGDGGSGGEASSCSDLTDCGTCRSCAADGPCADELAACLDNPICVAIDECLATCGATAEECWEICRAQNATGVDEYDAARGCLDCAECEQSCATPLVCGS